MSFSPIRRTDHRLALAALALSVVFVAGCSPPAVEDDRPWNVVIVLLDTLRADHLGAYGYERDTSPNLDAFAAANVFFADNRSQASCTWPSVNSILTSRYGQRFWGRRWGLMGIPEGTPTLAEILTEHGYGSVAVSASPVVRKTPSWANKEGGFDRGFAVFHEKCAGEADAECINRQAIGHMAAMREPFFLYLHYMETHAPYRPPASWERRFATEYAGRKKWIRRGDVGPLAKMIYGDGPDVGLTEIDLRHLKDLYDDELAYFDHRFAELLAAIEEPGIADRTAIVFLSDHGESFLEHEHFTHCRSVYETEIRVPLMMRLPGVDAPVRVERPVANLDVAPTLLDYLGIDAAPYGFEGESLRPWIEASSTPPGGGDASGGHLTFSHARLLRSVTDGRFKLIEDLGGTSPRVFDLSADPGETENLLDGERRTYRRLSAALEGWLAVAEPNARSRESREKAEETIRQLKAVGYLQ